MKKINITFPVVESRPSDNYALVIKDSAGVEHYFNFDGTYDGMSSDCHTDPETGTCLN